MIYAMSDIHGKYDKYIMMLERINFCKDDTLFILGDIVDRGEEPIKVIKDMMERPNVYPIMGNHDLMALKVLRKLAVEITESNYDNQVDSSVMHMLLDWIQEGGSTTLEKFRELGLEEREDILDYLEDFSHYETIDVGDRTFILVHAGLGNFRPGKKLSEYSSYELMMMRTNTDEKYFDDDTVYVVCGHTPTVYFSGKAEIYQKNNIICIDCGACFKNGRLACLCLDNMKEFYI